MVSNDAVDARPDAQIALRRYRPHFGVVFGALACDCSRRAQVSRNLDLAVVEMHLESLAI